MNRDETVRLAGGAMAMSKHLRSDRRPPRRLLTIAFITVPLACVSQISLYEGRAAILRSDTRGGWPSAAARRSPMALELTTAAFPAGGTIPKKFTCDGADVSPALSWTDPPAGTQSFALVADDPDAPAGTWVHWVLYELPAATRKLPEGVGKQPELPDGSRQGRNDFGKIGYNGPCPPRGPTHRYFFKLYALDSKLDLKPGATKADVERAMKNHALAHAELIGKFSH